MTCLTCHDPHSKVASEDRAEHYRQACLGCHEERFDPDFWQKVSTPGVMDNFEHQDFMKKALAAIDAQFADQELVRARLLQTMASTLRSLGLEEIGVELDPRTGHVLVDEQYKTNVKSIYAIGDLIPGPALAHIASAEGIAAVENIAGLPGEVNYDAIPSIIYTWPEVASVGLTEEQLKERDIPYCVGTYPFAGAGRARCMGEKDGFVKILAHAKTDRILGVHILGPRAADMIAECVLAVEFGAVTWAVEPLTLGAEVSEATFHRWRNQYGGMKAEEAKRLKYLEDENKRLKQLVAEKELDIQMLKEITKGN